MIRPRSALLAAVRATFAISCIASQAAHAQASLRGRVLTDSTELPISGVVVAIDALKISAMSDSLGNFMLGNVKAGAHIVTAKKIGFAALATRVRFGASDKLEADFLMTPSAQALPEAKVETKASLGPKLAQFDERRLSGNGGRFLTPDVFEKRTWSSTVDVLRSNVPGLDFAQPPGMQSAKVAIGGRLQVPGGAFTNGGNKPQPCPAAVVIDGAFVYQGNNEPLFDINSIPTTSIAAVEYYASAASMPAKYNGTRGTCGLLMIWTK